MHQITDNNSGHCFIAFCCDDETLKQWAIENVRLRLRIAFGDNYIGDISFDGVPVD